MSNEVVHRALVTGTSSGIGEAVARVLLAQGWQVQGLDLTPPRIAHAGLHAQQVNLCDGAAVQQLLQTLPPVGALVHAAGVLRAGPLDSLVPEDGERMWRLHVQAATLLANALVPSMAAAGHGRVVLVGSRVARGIAGRSQYAASKAALLSLARSWGAEVVARGVTVNVVSPAATQTAMLDDPMRSGTHPKLAPIGRLIQPEEVAALVAYLLSSAAAAITGQDIQICGGSSLAA